MVYCEENEIKMKYHPNESGALYVALAICLVFVPFVPRFLWFLCVSFFFSTNAEKNVFKL